MKFQGTQNSQNNLKKEKKVGFGGSTPIIPALWEADGWIASAQEFNTSLGNMTKTRSLPKIQTFAGCGGACRSLSYPGG